MDLPGTLAVDWLGVPLKAEGAKIGVLAVQTYRPEARLGEEEQALLTSSPPRWPWPSSGSGLANGCRPRCGRRKSCSGRSTIGSRTTCRSSPASSTSRPDDDQRPRRRSSASGNASSGSGRCPSSTRSSTNPRTWPTINFADYVRSLAVLSVPCLAGQRGPDPARVRTRQRRPGHQHGHPLRPDRQRARLQRPGARLPRTAGRDDPGGASACGAGTFELIVQDDGVGLPEGVRRPARPRPRAAARQSPRSSSSTGLDRRRATRRTRARPAAGPSANLQYKPRF